jgi:hypothetical protein
MAFQATIDIPAGSWTLLTPQDVTDVRVQCVGRGAVLLQATASTVAPASDEGAVVLYRYPPLAIAGAPLASFFPGVPGCNRHWAFAEEPTRVSISGA